jgi:protein TonB
MLNTRRSTAVLEVIPHNPTAPLSRRAPTGFIPAPPPPEASFRYYGIPPPARIPWVALVLSAGLHALAILGFNHRTVVQKHIVVDDNTSQMLMMPDLKDPEDEKPKELSDDEPLATPAIQVPMLADIPVAVPVDASFTQLLDLTIPAKADAAANSVINIPMNIQRGRPDTGGMKDLFNIADLDRKPEPIVQSPPVFPFELKQQIAEASVRVGFIVTSKGDVVMPYIISSTHSGFERSTLDAVVKWKFKPGMRGGKKVNTRVEQPINFHLDTDR